MSRAGIGSLNHHLKRFFVYQNSLVVCDKSGHTKFPFLFVVLSWGELWLICPKLSLILP